MTTKAAAKWERVAERLEAEGWAVSCEKVYLAEARREGHIEQATGETKDEAFGRLCQMTLQDSVEGCP
jgi:hypothetical protein